MATREFSGSSLSLNRFVALLQALRIDAIVSRLPHVDDCDLWPVRLFHAELNIQSHA